MGKTFKDNRKDHKIVDHRFRKKDKRRKQLDEITKEDEVVRDGHLHYSDSTERHPRRLRFEEQYDTSKAKDESPGKSIDTAPRESTCDVRDLGSEPQDGGGSGGGDN